MSAFDGPAYYEIRVHGRLSPHWAGWFDGLQVVDAGAGVTLLCGTLADQAALHGVLMRVRDLGLPLLSLTRIQADEMPGTAPDAEAS